MVDALCRARVWLKSDGRLIDLRPAHTIPDVVVGSDEHGDVVGALTVEAERHERHVAADRALAAVLDRRMFVLEEAREFTFLRYADSAEELRDYIASTWKQTRMDEVTCQLTATTVNARPGARVWLRERVVIRRLAIGTARRLPTRQSGSGLVWR
jgi:hypothetical protein